MEGQKDTEEWIWNRHIKSQGSDRERKRNRGNERITETERRKWSGERKMERVTHKKNSEEIEGVGGRNKEGERKTL